MREVLAFVIFGRRLMARAAAAVGLGFLAVGLAVLGGCEEEEPGCQLQQGVDPRSQDWGYDAADNAVIGTVYLSIAELQARSDAAIAKITESCRQIAVALGEPESAVPEGDADPLQAWCTLAQTRIGAATTTSIEISVDDAFCKLSLEEAAACIDACTLSTCAAPAALEEHCPASLSRDPAPGRAPAHVRGPRTKASCATTRVRARATARVTA
jgi:hypothetical protein